MRKCSSKRGAPLKARSRQSREAPADSATTQSSFIRRTAARWLKRRQSRRRRSATAEELLEIWDSTSRRETQKPWNTQNQQKPIAPNRRRRPRGTAACAACSALIVWSLVTASEKLVQLFEPLLRPLVQRDIAVSVEKRRNLVLTHVRRFRTQRQRDVETRIANVTAGPVDQAHRPVRVD